MKKYIFQFGHDSKLYIKAVAVMKKQPLAPNPTPTTTPEVIKKTIPAVETPDRANESSPDLSKTKELERSSQESMLHDGTHLEGATVVKFQNKTYKLYCCFRKQNVSEWVTYFGSITIAHSS